MLWFGISFHWVFAFGTLCALVGLAGKLRTSAALGTYLAYLSIVGAGQTFTAYQWDMFLIECLFAAAILARSPAVGVWVLRLLAFRFMFLSGARPRLVIDFAPIRRLEVWRRWSTGSRTLVGVLAQNRQGVFFQYDHGYLSQHPSLSPFTLPFDAGLHLAPPSPHKGLHGVFADSLPDC